MLGLYTYHVASIIEKARHLADSPLFLEIYQVLFRQSPVLNIPAEGC